MADNELQTYYYEKGRADYLAGLYDQPFPFPTTGELDEFERSCNGAYTKGYQEERLRFASFLI